MTGHRRTRFERIPIIRRKAAPGTAPGTLSVSEDAEEPRLQVIAYGPDDLMEKELTCPGDLAPVLGKWPVVWLNVDGLGDLQILEAIGEMFGLHRLALEDVVNVHQRPKFEAYDTNLFVVLRMVRLHAAAAEQVSMFIGDGVLLTFQERSGDSFDPVRDRIRAGRVRIRNSGPDYLAYALIDALIDGYYPVLETHGERIESLEEAVLADPTAQVATRIHATKRELLMIRRAIAPHREAMTSLIREESPLLDRETRVYLRDCYDHVIQLTEMVETYRELTSGLLDVHLTSMSNRMNEVMKVLTIFAAIFIPLSFIAGLYGMNFDPAHPLNMPETRWAFGYPAALLVMAAVAGTLLLYFRRKGWIGSGSQPEQVTSEEETKHDAR